MIRPLAALALALALALAPAAWAQGSYAKRPDVRAFIREQVERNGFVESELATLFSRARRSEPVLQAIEPQPPAARAWEEYRATFVNERRIAGGLAFWRAHRKALVRAQREFGVPAETIVAIIGVETFYGRNTGRWRVVDALTTLAFDYPPRAEFFRAELENYLMLARDAGIDVFSVRGSYAGAIGIPQFMPSSVRRYALDFDGNGAIDLQRSATDAIGSVANFLKQHGWQPGAGVAFRARVSGEAYRAYADGNVEPRHLVSDLAHAQVVAPEMPELPAAERAALVALETPERPSEYRIGLNNFYVLTRYNRSALYAAAVADLAKELRARQEAGR